MNVLDLFSGLGGWSAAFKDRGHAVTTLDINPKFKPDIVKDILEIKSIAEIGKFDIILASPPCTEFSKASMPSSWNRNRSVNPDTTIMRKTYELISAHQPRLWAIENVRGSVKFFTPIIGNYRQKIGSRYLWGNFPILNTEPVYGKWKLPPSPDRAALRALIPYSLSLAMCEAAERDLA